MNQCQDRIEAFDTNMKNLVAREENKHRSLAQTGTKESITE